MVLFNIFMYASHFGIKTYFCCFFPLPDESLSITSTGSQHTVPQKSRVDELDMALDLVLGTLELWEESGLAHSVVYSLIHRVAAVF